MGRRKYVSSWLITLAAPPILGPTSALATAQNDPDEVRRERVRLMLAGGGPVLLTTLFIVTASVVWFLSMNRLWWRYPLSRASVGGVLGKLTQPTVQNRISTMDLMGTAFVVGSVMYVVLDVALKGPPRPVTIVNQDNEFTNNGKAREVVDQKQVTRINRVVQQFTLASVDALMSVLRDPKTGEIIVLVPKHLRLNTPRS